MNFYVEMNSTNNQEENMIDETKNGLSKLRLLGMLKSLSIRLDEATVGGWSHGDFLAAMTTDELFFRRLKQTEQRIKRAKFRSNVTLDHFDYTTKRSLDKKQVQSLKELNFIAKKQTLVLIGPTGVGKTFLATSLGHHACENGHNTVFMGMNVFIEKAKSARLTNEFLKFRDQLIKCDLLILDDLGIRPLTNDVVQDLYDILEERYQNGATIITSQLPLKNWKEVIDDPVALEAIVDRVVHGMKIEITGESYRKKKGIDKA
jgi:DNA replication protein DnaC